VHGLVNMSRIGRQPVEIPSGVNVTVDGVKVSVKGPKGELARDFAPLRVGIVQADDLTVEQKKADSARWGLARALLANMVHGVAEGFSKSLELHGVGYKAKIAGQKLTLDLGFSHQVAVDVPEGITATVEKDIITFSGVDREVVGNIADKVRKLRPPEPYKGKGLRYVGEHVRRKEGKKAVTEGSPGAGS